MAEEERKDAMMALGRIVLAIEGLKMDYKQDVQTIIYALQSSTISETQLESETKKTAMSETQSPPVPSNLNDNITITMDRKGNLIMDLSNEYSKLEKGE